MQGSLCVGQGQWDEGESETPGDAFDFEEGLHGKKSKRLITDQVVRATCNVSPRERRR